MGGGTRVTGPATARGLVVRGKVLSCLSNVVRVDPDGGDPTDCDLLVTSGGTPLQLEPGDVVLIWRESSNGRAIILGRLNRDGGRANVNPPMPDELLLEARNGLILRVGEGSITLRADGKILIKGKDLVSHAKRTNRIKGGSVSLN